MKKIFGVLILGALLSGCEVLGINDELRSMKGEPSHSKYYKKAVKNNPGYKYYVLVKSPSTNKILWGAHNTSYSAAFDGAINSCKTWDLYDCVPHTRG